MTSTLELKRAVEAYYSDIRESSPLFLASREGRLDPKGVAYFVRNARSLIEYTPVYLQLAMERCQTERPKLSEFFRVKKGEEVGHDVWAANDFERLKQRWSVEGADALSPSIQKLILYLEEVIRRDPADYLAYIFLAEYLTVLGGARWLQDLQQHCGVPSSCVTVIGNHVVLDVDHVEDDLSALEALVDTAYYLPRWMKVLEDSMALHRSFLAEAGSHVKPEVTHG